MQMITNDFKIAILLKIFVFKDINLTVQQNYREENIKKVLNLSYICTFYVDALRHVCGTRILKLRTYFYVPQRIYNVKLLWFIGVILIGLSDKQFMKESCRSYQNDNRFGNGDVCYYWPTTNKSCWKYLQTECWYICKSYEFKESLAKLLPSNDKKQF